MSTRIDERLNAFMQSLLTACSNEQLQNLFDAVREAYALDMVFWMENHNYLYEMSYAMVSVRDSAEQERMGHLQLSEQEYVELMQMYQKDLVCDRHLAGIGDSDSVLHMGIFVKDYYCGCVGFRLQEKHSWTEEECMAIRKLGKAVMSFLAVNQKPAIAQEIKHIQYVTAAKGNSIAEMYVNLQEDTSHIFRIPKYLKPAIPEWNRYHETLKTYCELYVDPWFTEQLQEQFSIQSLVEHFRERREMVTAEYRKTVNGKAKWYRVSAVLADTDRKGEPYHAAISIEDITHMAAEREKNYYVFKLLKENYCRIFMINLESDRYSIIKEFEYEQKGELQDDGSFSEMTAQIGEECVLPEYRNKFYNVWSCDYLKRHFDKSNRAVSVEYRRKVDGRYRYFRTEFIACDDFEDKKNIAIAYVRDISEEMQRREENNQIIESLGSIYFCTYLIHLKEGTFREVMANDSARQVVGMQGDSAQALNRYMLQVVAKEYRQGMQQFTDLSTAAERIGNKAILSMEYISVLNGWCRGSFIPVKRDENGTVTQVIYAVSHIDENKKQELETQHALRAACDAATRASNAKTDFLSRMSHDIRTPMNVIAGMTEIAEECIEDREKVLQCLKKIAISSKHLLSLLDEVLDMSRIESGAVLLNEEAFSLQELIRETKELIQSGLDERKQNFTVSWKGELHDKVLGDRIRIQQILLNILGNAIKYTPDAGSISLTIESNATRQESINSFRFVIADNGIGMSKQYLAHIFEPFSRESDSRTSKIKGTGLGMAIVHSLVHMMNGNIHVESKLGKGSRFTVTLYMKVLDESLFPVQGEEIKSKKTYAEKCVLVVEDQMFNREILEEFLQMLLVRAEFAENGRQAVTMVAASEEAHYDLIIMDIQMPVMNGYEAAKAIRKLPRQDVKTMPIIAMTANAFAEDIQQVMLAGMNQHVAKPISMKILRNILDKW